jgi:deoxyribodipyrimidine photo-lyase
MTKYTLFWFRRDLRLTDNVGLFKALSKSNKVIPIFIFDTNILSKLPIDDPRIQIIYDALESINELLNKYKSNIGCFKGNPLNIIKDLVEKITIEKVIFNHDYEPYAIKRDKEIITYLKQNNIEINTYKDQVVFEKNEVVKSDGTPYKVYTPFSKLWIKNYESIVHEDFSSEKLLMNFASNHSLQFLNFTELGFAKSKIELPSYKFNSTIIKEYESTRNFPSLDNTSKLGVYLRFGLLSIRKLVHKANMESDNTFLKELIWREFFMQILWHFPNTVESSFKPKYDRIEWLNNEDDFKKWCSGNTGYPIVDAGMRELNNTGFMHNRVRMIVGSFLCKHLLIDWRLGEAYFASKLLDYEQSSNIGNWQWVAGCGVDAVPYFRIFNPYEQVKKFDKKLLYIKKWVPELEEMNYPEPIIDHKFARERCLKVYKSALD